MEREPQVPPPGEEEPQAETEDTTEAMGVDMDTRRYESLPFLTDIVAMTTQSQ